MLGSIFALTSAFLWACAVILFKKSGDVFSPLTLNIYKSFVALILLSLTMIILDIPFFPAKPIDDWLLLSASGFLGITLADLFFFIALNRLGAGLMAIVECLYLPCVIFFSFFLLGEHLNTASIVGGFLVLSAVFVGSIKTGKPMDEDANPALKNKTLLPGILIGSFSIILLAAGIVMIKNLLEHTDVFWATFVRVAAATVSLIGFILVHPKRKKYLRELKISKAWLIALPASITGNYLALLFWVAGMKYTSASRAAILNQMSTVFIFILAAIFLKEKITLKKSLAILLALSGACLTILN